MKKPPCIGCEFEKMEKGCPECRNCNARVAHAAAIELSGAATPSSSMVWTAGMTAITMLPQTKEIHMVQMKTCTNCENEYELNENNFYKNKACRDGFEGQCKTCRAIKHGKNPGGKRGPKPKQKEPIHSVSPAQASGRASVKPDTEARITLDFSKCSYLLAGLQKMADKHYRSVDQQILWMIDCAVQAEAEVE